MSGPDTLEMTESSSQTPHDADQEPNFERNSDSDASEMDEETGLTNRERRHKILRRGDEEIEDTVADTITKQEARIADRNVVKRLVLNSVLILLWYFFSLAISIVSTEHNDTAIWPHT